MLLLLIHRVEVNHYWEVDEHNRLNHPRSGERAIGLQGPGGGGLADDGEEEEGVDGNPVVAVGVPHLDESRELLRDCITKITGKL